MPQGKKIVLAIIRRTQEHRPRQRQRKEHRARGWSWRIVRDPGAVLGGSWAKHGRIVGGLRAAFGSDVGLSWGIVRFLGAPLSREGRIPERLSADF